MVGTGNSSAKAESLSLAGVIPQNLMVRVVIITAARFFFMVLDTLTPMPRKVSHIIGLDSAEGKVLRRDAHLAERIEQGAFAHIGHANNSHL